MPIKKYVTVMTAGSFVCLAVLGLRSPATAQHEKMAEVLGFKVFSRALTATQVQVLYGESRTDRVIREPRTPRESSRPGPSRPPGPARDHGPPRPAS